MKKFLAITLSLVMVLGLVACGQTENQTQKAEDGTDLAYVQNKGKLIIGITDFKPMDYKAEGSNEWIGFDADLAKAFAESIGVKVEFIEIEWESKEMELDNKNIDCIWNGMTITDGVKAAMDVSNAYCDNSQIIVVKKDKADSIKTVEDAKSLKFAVEGGSAGEDAAKENQLTFTALSAQTDALMEVASGTSDACIIDSIMAKSMCGEGTSYPDLTYTVGLTQELYGVGFRKGSNIVASLNDFFVKAYADGTFKTIGEKYDMAASLIEQK